MQHAHVLLEYVGRCNVNLGDDKEEGDAQRQCNAQVLARHALEAGVGVDYDHGIVWTEADEAEDRRLQVLLVAAEIDEGNEPLGLAHDVLPAGVSRGCSHSSRTVGIHQLALLIETHDLLCDAAGATILGLVREVENAGTSKPSAVVQQALCQHAHERRLAAVHVAYCRNLDIFDALLDPGVLLLALGLALLNALLHLGRRERGVLSVRR
mmetsp:Transcript_37682/g.87521  ORF Transcript_37682/g.87521 Transcript_37682/m.87521 type:complete len:210 (-) Transcript_37682:106-735(-)